MDVVSDIEVIESDVRDVEQKCEKVNCSAIYDAIIASLKLLYDLIFVCDDRCANPRNYFPASPRVPPMVLATK